MGATSEIPEAWATVFFPVFIFTYLNNIKLNIQGAAVHCSSRICVNHSALLIRSYSPNFPP